jgi:predicted PP-loop superfamily ATPase
MDNVNKVLEECKELLENCKKLDKELKAMKEGREFLLKEYETNKRWFREEPGRVTVKDVIKAAFEFGWASCKNFNSGNHD